MRLLHMGLVAPLALAGCAGLPNQPVTRGQSQAGPAPIVRSAPLTRGRRVSPEEENPPIARMAERTPLPAPDDTPIADSAPTAEDAQIARERHHEQREQAIKQRMNSICSGC